MAEKKKVFKYGPHRTYTDVPPKGHYRTKDAFSAAELTALEAKLRGWAEDPTRWLDAMPQHAVDLTVER